MIFDVLDAKGERVASIEKIFAREEEGCFGGICRALHDFSNYVVTFPPGATLQEKQLLLGALTQVEYLYFVPKCVSAPSLCHSLTRTRTRRADPPTGN